MIQIYVIGCDELPERKQEILSHLKMMHMGLVKFVSSVHGKTWGLETTREYEPGKRISSGHVGLCLGHWIAWQIAYNSHHHADAWLLFLEDDAVLPDGWGNRLAELWKELDERYRECEFCFVGLAETEPHVWHKVTERIGGGDSRLCRLNDPFGTHAYLVRKRALPVLIDRMRMAERNMDQQLFQYVLKDNHLQWCAVLPTLVQQRTFDYTGSGKPQWAPSCVDVDELGHPVLSADTQDVQRSMGAQNVGDRLTPELYQSTINLIDPLACIYRGEALDDVGFTPDKRSAPLFQCARLNSACHAKQGAQIKTRTGTQITACETCPHRLEMAASSVRERLPLPDGHFNPSMLVYNDRLILATRDSWGHSKVALWELNNDQQDWSGEWNIKPIGSYQSDHKDAPRLEDPRLFVAPDDNDNLLLHAMFNLPDGYPPKKVNVGYVRFAPDLSGITSTLVFKSPVNNKYEKNWVPFHHYREGLCWIYGTKSKHIVMGERQTWKTPNNLPWTGGVIRGGAAPVKWGWNPKNGYSVYYHFFHGCLTRVQGRVYTMGCCVFEAEPPFRILRQTETPLIWPDLPAVGEEVVKRYVVFPGGAVAHAGHWHVAIGVDDTFVRIVKLPFDVVESALNDVPESVDKQLTSIRDTPLAMGIPE